MTVRAKEKALSRVDDRIYTRLCPIATFMRVACGLLALLVHATSLHAQGTASLDAARLRASAIQIVDMTSGVK
jgi:hypothetical protein